MQILKIILRRLVYCKTFIEKNVRHSIEIIIVLLNFNQTRIQQSFKIVFITNVCTHIYIYMCILAADDKEVKKIKV